MESYVSILDVKCTPATWDPTGEVRDGYINIEGPVVSCFPWRMMQRMWLNLPDRSAYRELVLDNSTAEFDAKQKVLCLRLARYREGMANNPTYWEYSLILACVDGSTRRYKRLGIVRERLKKKSGDEWESSFSDVGQMQELTIV